MRSPILSARCRHLGAALVALLVTAATTVWAPAAAASPRDDRPSPAHIVEPMLADSSNVPCAPGTNSLGVLPGYNRGEPTRIHLCELPNLAAQQSAEESNPGTKYYIKGANRHAVVNARISGVAFEMVEAAKADGVMLIATSSFRRDVHQQDLYQCYLDQRPGCLAAAEPGWSIHQMGLALDFNLPQSYDTCDGGLAANNPAWRWLNQNAADYGFRQLQAENWHWDTTTSGEPMCP